MKIYSKEDIDKYLKNDWVLKELQNYLKDQAFASHRWLLNIPAKRMIYADIYSELLQTKEKKVLDIAGGFCGLSRQLIKNHDYTLVDIMSGSNQGDLREIEKTLNRKFWNNEDWDEFNLEKHYDFIIANDIFPNVDQRLGKFLRKFQGKAGKIIITLTCYNQQSFLADWAENIIGIIYNKIRRVNGDKIIFVRAPSTTETNKILTENITGSSPVLPESAESIFTNGRIVYKLEI